jgi:Ran GTPase-activating protein (RanGAP) involved in mRNA processing and transport
LPALPDLTHTLFLDISSQKIGDSAVARLVHSPLMPQVHGLNLSSNCLSDDGLDTLHDSPHLANLRELYLGDNAITDDGIRRFVMSPMVEKLDVLDVRYTRISRESVDVLTHILGDKLIC